MDVGCSSCGKPLKRRRNGKGWNRNPLQGQLKSYKVTVHFAMSELCDYKVNIDLGYIHNSM